MTDQSTVVGVINLGKMGQPRTRNLLQEALDEAMPVLEVFGERICLVGPNGAGTVVKLANQLLVGINMAGVAEALVMRV